eukprot:TRINITY_DN6337_c0_g1_i1.p1 TRINITY_DN6337_c0_g1~~TRINITY_DN6337_c0_g1_i1.p1  ORF type:complete len:381 (-),score=46.63 TRINITY_DN6337_c0_g1_i1:712-1818(-)
MGRVGLSGATQPQSFRTPFDEDSEPDAGHQDDVPSHDVGQNINNISVRTKEMKQGNKDKEKPFKCTEQDCDKSYVLKHGLAKHIKDKHPASSPAPASSDISRKKAHTERSEKKGTDAAVAKEVSGMKHSFQYSLHQQACAGLVPSKTHPLAEQPQFIDADIVMDETVESQLFHTKQAPIPIAPILTAPIPAAIPMPVSTAADQGRSALESLDMHEGEDVFGISPEQPGPSFDNPTTPSQLSNDVDGLSADQEAIDSKNAFINSLFASNSSTSSTNTKSDKGKAKYKRKRVGKKDVILYSPDDTKPVWSSAFSKIFIFGLVIASTRVCNQKTLGPILLPKLLKFFHFAPDTPTVDEATKAICSRIPEFR